MKMKSIPSAHPHNDRTYGKHKTPDPIAQAHNENILPLTLPLPIGPKVLYLKFLEFEIGDMTNLDSFISNSEDLGFTCYKREGSSAKLLKKTSCLSNFDLEDDL